MPLADFISDAYQDADAMVDRVRTAFLPSVSGSYAGNVSPADMLQGSSMAAMRASTLTHHAEQYRHFVGWPYAIIRIIANRIAGQHIRLARRVEDNGAERGIPTGLLSKHLPLHLKAIRRELRIINDHPLLRIIHNPNQIMTGWSLIFVTVASMELTGKAYWWFYKDEERGLQIWPLPAHWVEEHHEEDELYAWWEVKPDGFAAPVRIAGPAIVQFNYPDPSNPMISCSPLQAQARAVVADESIQEAQRRAFNNSINPGIALVVGRHPDAQGNPGQRPYLDKAQRMQLIAAVKQQYRGVVNHDEPLILDGLITDAKKITHNPREMDFLDSSSLSKDRLAQSWGVNPVSMGQLEGANRACTDVHSQLLTRRGWLTYDEITEDDLAGTVNPITHKFEWQKIQKIHIYPDFSGEMVKLSGQKIDALFTPEHRMWKTRHTQGKWNAPFRPVQRDLPWGFSPAGELKSFDGILLAPRSQSARRAKQFIIPGARVKLGRHDVCKVTPDLKINMDVFLEFLGWWVSEGWTTSCFQSCTGQELHGIGIRQAIGATAECEAIDRCVKSLGGLNSNRYFRKGVSGSDMPDGYDRQDSYTWVMTDKRLWIWLRQHCGVDSGSKRLPDFVFDLSGKQLEILLDALLLGDGSHRAATEDKNYSGKTASYFSKSEVLVDQVQTLALLCGRASRRCKQMSNGVYPVTVSSYCDTATLLSQHISREQYTGTVWCVTVPNGLVITRRNGKPIVSGNSSATADTHFVTNVVNPKAVQISEILTQKVAPLFEKGLVIYIEEAHADDPDYDLKVEESMYDRGVMPANEWRARHHLSPLAGTNGRGAWVESNRTFVALTIEDNSEMVSRAGHCLAKGAPDEMHLKLFLKQQAVGEKRLTRRLASVFRDLGDSLLRSLREAAERGPLSSAMVLTEPTGEWQTRLNAAARLPLMQQALVGCQTEWELFAPRKSSGGIDTSNLPPAIMILALNLPFEVREPTREYVESLLRQPWWQDLSRSVLNEVGEAIQAAVLDGKTRQELSEQLQDILGPAAAEARARRIARTETVAALNHGHDIARQRLAQAGLLKAKVWLSVLCPTTRAAHAEAHGQQVPPLSDFTVGGERCAYPGDQRLSAWNRINCLCTIRSVTIYEDEKP